MSGRLFVVSAPSGAGKTTLIKEVRKQVPDLQYSVSHTTRRPRAGEKDGVSYHFVSRGTFEHMIANGEFVEWAEVYGEYYGTSVWELERQLSKGRDLLLDLDVQGARNIKKFKSDAKLIFVLPPSMEELQRRLENRGTDEYNVIRKRLAKAESEIAQALFYDYAVINDRLHEATKEMVSIIISDRCSIDRREDFIKQNFNIFSSK